MVLKRLLVTALGALGLGALAAGPAFGQEGPGAGNIPAPNLFDDQIACTMNLPNMAARVQPTVVPMGEDDSPLDTIIGMGNHELDSTDSVFSGITDSATILANLGYVVPPGGNNCGQGMGAAVPQVDGMDVGFFVGAQDASIPMDVAEGYSDLLTKFMAVYGDPGDAMSTGAAGALAMARTMLAIADADDDNYETLQEAVADALEAYNKAKAEFDAGAAGPIYTAGVAEWMAKSAVTNAIETYNTAVTMANAAMMTLDDTDYVSVNVADDGTVTTASKYVALTGTELTGLVTIANGMATINATTDAMALRDYANADGDQFATVDSMTGQVTYTGTSNFDRSGNLVIPTEEDTGDRDGDGDTGDYVPAINSNNGVDDIRTTVENYNAAAAAFKKLRDDNQNVLLQDLYDVVYQRAQAEADYYNGIWAEVISDTTDQRTQTERAAEGDDAVDPYSIASRYSASVRTGNARSAAESDLRQKAAAREMATEAVVTAFQTPATFYEQLVARRQAKKFAADKAVADAETPTDAQTKAAADAAKALMDAEDAQSNFRSLFSDASDPVQELVTELLKTDGDDGQKLVDAISGSYDVANTAKETADKVAEDVAGLTGDEGAVSQNTAAIKENASDIEDLDERVAMNEGEIWDANGMSRIDANETRSMTNATNIATNATNIMTNAENIVGLRTDVDMNSEDIMTNAGNIMTNSGRITANEGAISSNAEAIASNMNSIGQNASAIGRNSEMITGLQDQMEIVRAGVAASMALAGMPAINGRGISIGVGSFDGESAFAVGFQIQSDMASFKVGVTSAGGETGASAGVGFQF